MSSGTSDGTATTRQPVCFSSASDSLAKSGIRSETSSSFFRPVEEFVAGAPRQKFGLAFEKRAPDAVLGRSVAVPVLVDGKIGADFRMLRAKLVERGHGKVRYGDCVRVLASSAGSRTVLPRQGIGALRVQAPVFSLKKAMTRSSAFLVGVPGRSTRLIVSTECGPMPPGPASFASSSIASNLSPNSRL